MSTATGAASLPPEQVTAIVLCGGGGRRLGGIDKALLRVGGRALVEHVIARLRPQVGKIVLSLGAGQNEEAFQGFGCGLVVDTEPDQGPLGGLVSCFANLPGEWFLSCPADAPWTAPTLVDGLSADARARGAAVAHDGRRRQNLTLLAHRRMALSLARFYAGGGRAAHRWLDAHSIPATDLSALADSFVNINTPEDLAACRRSLAAD